MRVIKLEGAEAETLRQLHLHRADLEQAVAWLDAIPHFGGEDLISEALWRSAVVSYVRTFRSCKGRLHPAEVYKDVPDVEHRQPLNVISFSMSFEASIWNMT